MNEQQEYDVRAKAYEIWENAGQPDGEHESHWHQALKELGLISPVDQTATAPAVDDVEVAPPVSPIAPKV